MSKVIDDAMGKPECKWKLLKTQEDFLAAVRRRTSGPKRKHRTFEALAIVTKNDKKSKA